MQLRTLITKCFVKKRKSVKCLFALCVLAFTSSLVLFYVFYSNQFSNRITFFVKDIIDPWESSLPGDHETCSEIIPVLLSPYADEGQVSSSIFSWETPKFADLLLKHSIERNATGDNVEEHLKDMLCERYLSGKVENDLDLSHVVGSPSLTSIPYTFYAVNDKALTVGDEIEIRIETRDTNGGKTANGGGDFFKIRAENLAIQSSVAASQINHLGEGRYQVKIKTFWSGQHDIKIFFGQSGHFIDLVKRLTSQFRSFKSEFVGNFKDSTCTKSLPTLTCPDLGTGRTPCHTDQLMLGADKEKCNYSGGEGEGWYCLKPAAPLTCSNLHAVYSKRRQNSLDIFSLFPLHDRGSLNRVTIHGTPTSLVVADGSYSDASVDELPRCGSGLTTPSPSGYWLNGVWVSRLCKNFHFSSNPQEKGECLRDRLIYLIGDSTARQWFEYFLEDVGKFKSKETTSFTDVWEPRTAVLRDFNTTIHYRSHGQPLQNGGPYFATRFTSAQLDEIPALYERGRLVTIVIALGPHFLLYNPDVFLKRVTTIRDAALRLIDRNPQITVIFKGTNTFVRGIGIGECCLTDWLNYRFHRISKHIFDGSPVIYLDVWDMTVSHNSEDLVHPVRDVITSEIDMALSFFCPK